MWVNLHNLPAGQSMYTVAITDDPIDTPADDIWYEELDVVTSSRATALEVVAAANDQLDDYPSRMRVIGVSDQSSGYVMWQDPKGNLR